MKINKFMIAAIAAATMFASCSKEDVNNEIGNKVLTVSLSNPTTQSKAVGSAGTEDAATITPGDGIIFILDAVGNVKQAVGFADNFPGTAQQITDVAASDKVYVIANIGATNKTAWKEGGVSKPTTLTALKALSMSIADATYGQNYAKATTANAEGDPVEITVGSGATAAVSVEIKPVYSRLELGSITAAGTITGFEVAGVYVDDYFPEYTMGLSHAGTIYKQSLSTDFTLMSSVMKDDGEWLAHAITKEAKPETGNKWVYNVPAGNMPRLIIKLTKLSGVWNGQTLTNAEGPYFLTIADYGTPGSTTTFLPGNIYRITDGIMFDESNIAVTPNAKKVTLTVEITNTPWKFKGLTANLM